MKTKITVLTLCAMLLALCSSVAAQQAAKSRIGYLDTKYATASGMRGPRGRVRQELTKLGWIEDMKEHHCDQKR